MCAFPCFDRFPALFFLLLFLSDNDPNHPAKNFFSSNNFFFPYRRFFSCTLSPLSVRLSVVFVSFKKSSFSQDIIIFFRLLPHTHKLSYFFMLNSRRASLYIKESFFFFPFLVCSPSQLCSTASFFRHHLLLLLLLVLLLFHVQSSFRAKKFYFVIFLLQT